MNKYYLFLSSDKIDRLYFREALRALSGHPVEVYYESDKKGYFYEDSSLYGGLAVLLSTIHDDLGLNLVVLVAHERKGLEEKALVSALSYFKNMAVYLPDVLFKEFSFGDFSSLPLLKEEFFSLPPDLLETAGTYLRVGCEATAASKALFIHRNTFNYRLSAFIEKTGLDIRDYHNALLLEIYFQYLAR